MNNKQKSIIHAMLMDHNLSVAMIPYTHEIQENDRPKVVKIMTNAQLAMTDFVSYILGETEDLSEGCKLIIGNLVKRHSEILASNFEAAVKNGQKLPQEFFDNKELIDGLNGMFPTDIEDAPRIITP